MTWIGEEIRAYGHTFRQQWKTIAVVISGLAAFMVLAPAAASAPRPTVYKPVVSGTYGDITGTRANFGFRITLKPVSGRGRDGTCRNTTVRVYVSDRGNPLNGTRKVITACWKANRTVTGWLSLPRRYDRLLITVWAPDGNSQVVTIRRR